MSQNDANPDNIPSPDFQKEGEQVTGGSEGNQTENAETSSDDQETDQEEYTPSTETTKEEMTGYNELPDQEKVGGA
ncbi:hypothetical protein [Adhaeribacter pallidiroseus]|uniref:Uncharacterized protein n=1 Tax=Adhaeribacter pallidiroseus TaxID=2072847 RepID=A0A369QNJ5_9BACT|nr:hypothetical protein [Adhaeribacter pallidiroseus]RDC66461.1 hypothetical protein AHMF7616_05092 [Adhaeribacter pallidiroseus]